MYLWDDPVALTPISRQLNLWEPDPVHLLYGGRPGRFGHILCAYMPGRFYDRCMSLAHCLAHVCTKFYALEATGRYLFSCLQLAKQHLKLVQMPNGCMCDSSRFGAYIRSER
jgi:hypothetical protein